MSVAVSVPSASVLMEAEALRVLKSRPAGQRPQIKPLVPSALVPALNPTLVVDGAGLEKVRAFLQRVSVFVYDSETNIVKTFFHRKVRTLQLGDKNEQYIIDLLPFAGSPDQLALQQGHYGIHAKFFQPIKAIIAPALQSKSHLKVGHSLQFDYEVSKWCFGMRPWNFYDTQVVEHVIYMGLIDPFETGFWGMEDCARRWCNLQIDKSEQKLFDLETPLTESQIAYCALDVRIPLAIKNGQQKELQVTNLTRTAQIENDAIPFYADMCLNGIYLNPASWRALVEENKADLAQVIRELDKEFVPLVGSKVPPDPEIMAALEKTWRDLDGKSAEEDTLTAALRATKDKEEKERIKLARGLLEIDRKKRKAEARDAYMTVQKQTTIWKKESVKWEGEACINYNAAQQIMKALLKAPRLGFTEKNLPNTNDKTLDKHASKPIVKLIRRYRGLSKLIDTYGEVWLRLRSEEKDPGYTDPDTGRIHARHNQTGTDTGRGSCSDPNLQNIPKKDKYRACFQARPHHKIVNGDFSGQEPRIATEMSQEPAWIDACNKGWDIHCTSAEILYEKKWRDATVHTAYDKTVIEDGKEKIVHIPICAYYHSDHKRCLCPDHEEMRGWLKNVSLGVLYGKSAYALAADLEITVDEAEQLLATFARKLPKLWNFLITAGEMAWNRGEARTLAQRRRLIDKEPRRLWAQAAKSAAEKYKDRIPEGQSPVEWMIKSCYTAASEAIKRQGRNTPIQGTGADMAKLAFGCGFDPTGKPYLWHILEPEFSGYQVNAVHDEGVGEVPDSPEAPVSVFYTGTGIVEGNAQRALDAMMDCMHRAGAEFVKSVKMAVDGRVDTRWRK